MAQGMAFDADSVRRQTQEAHDRPGHAKARFPNGEDPVGQVIFLGAVPVRRVTSPQESGFMMSDNLNVLWVPYTTTMRRLLGVRWLRNVTVRISDDAPAAAEQGIVKLLTQRHGTQDFFVRNSDSGIRQTIESTTQTMTLLISSIAVISLIVGHRGHEHHAGVGDRTNPGNRCAHGGGGAPKRHPSSVSD